MSNGHLAVLAVDTQELRKAELVAGINLESELQSAMAKAQKEVARLQESSRQFVAKTWDEIHLSQRDEETCSRKLTSIDRMRAELLDITPEGKRIKTLQSEIKELQFPNGTPVLVATRHQQQIAIDRSVYDPREKDVANRLGYDIEKIEGRIAERTSEIDRLWIVLLTEPSLTAE